MKIINLFFDSIKFGIDIFILGSVICFWIYFLRGVL